MLTKNTNQTYSYWETFRYANDKDVFEVVESLSTRTVGKRVIFKKVGGDSLVMKKYGEYDDESADTLVTPYGSITGARFKRVEEYVKIELEEAVTLLKQGYVFYTKLNGEYKEVSKYTYFSVFGILDFDDLVQRDFYTKK